jgi:hypothetical protein
MAPLRHDLVRRERAAKDLYKHFGITPEKVAEAALSKLGRT